MSYAPFMFLHMPMVSKAEERASFNMLCCCFTMSGLKFVISEKIPIFVTDNTLYQKFLTSIYFIKSN